MVKHIVLFKLKNDIPANEKQGVMQVFKTAIEALKESIPFLIDVEVGLNVNPAESWDIALTATLENMDDVQRYAIHPAHVAAAKLLADVKENRACVDYIF